MSSNQPQRRERGGLGAGRRVEKRWREMGRGVEKRIVLSLAVQSATSSITMASGSPTFHHIELLNASDATMSAWADTVPPLSTSPETSSGPTPMLEDSKVAAAADGEATPAAATPAGEAAVEEPQTPVTIHVWGHPSWKWLGPISRTPWKSPTTVHLHEHGSEFEARSVAPR